MESNKAVVIVVIAIVGFIALAIIGGDVWLISQSRVMPATLETLVTAIVVGLLAWLAPSPLKNPAQPPAPIVGTAVTTLSPIRQAQAGLIAAHADAVASPNLDDHDPPHLAGAIMDGAVADPFGGIGA